MSHRNNSAGFTIIELLIATAILSTILVMVTAMMISISNLYYKGINQSRIQDNVRSLADEIAQQLELNKNTPIHVGPIGALKLEAYCLGNFRYSYAIGKQLQTDIKHVLWRDKISSGDTCLPASLNSPTPNNPSTPGTEGVELMAPKSRLLKFSISPLTTPYTIVVDEAYGDTDLLCDSGTPGDCNSGSASSHIWNPNTPTAAVLCKGDIGQQFCATSRLTTTVTQRLR